MRLTLAFAGPPEDDIDWEDVSPHASAKFLARAWRLANDVRALAASTEARRRGAAPSDTPFSRRRARRSPSRSSSTCSSRASWSSSTLTRKAIDIGPGPADAAVREATEVITIALSLFAPYTAEEMWERLGYEPTVALAGWRKADPTLLVEDSVTAVVQVDGKVRDRLEVSPKIGSDELEKLARASVAVARAVGDREIVTVIVRAPRLVNIATKSA